MGPFSVVSLLESTTFVRAENARWSGVANELALPTQPLTLRYEWHSVAFLVHSQIAAVAENDGVRILSITVVTYHALRIALFTSRLAIDGCCTT
jgi:hypothetical protein